MSVTLISHLSCVNPNEAPVELKVWLTYTITSKNLHIVLIPLNAWFRSSQNTDFKFYLEIEHKSWSLPFCYLTVWVLCHLRSLKASFHTGIWTHSISQGSRNIRGKGAADLPIFLNYSSKDPFLSCQYSRILVVCPNIIWNLPTPSFLFPISFFFKIDFFL